MASMKDFLTKYYSRYVFRKMAEDHEQFVQFCGYVKNDKLTKNQEKWAEENLKKTGGAYATIPASGLYIPEDLPDSAELDDDEWKKMYLAFQRAFQNMDSAKSSFADNKKANKFFNDYFGTTSSGIVNMFQHPKIQKSNEIKIYEDAPTSSSGSKPKTLYHFLHTYKNQLKSVFENGYYSPLSDDFTYDELMTGIKGGKYKTDAGFRKKFMNIVSYIEGSQASLADTTKIPIADFPPMSDYDKWFENNVDPSRLRQFKDEYPRLLNRLYNEKDTREEFSKHDGGKISGPLNKVMGKMSYNDPKSDDYVQPKREDELTVSEKISEWWSDTYSETIEKYVKFKGDELYFSPHAKAICKNLPKDLKKTDNLDTVLKALGTAKEKLKSKHEVKTLDHLKWFESTLTSIRDDKNMSKVWAGALKNGRQTQALAKEIIMKGVKDNKIEEAKTALEMLSVLHFGFTTSKIMDSLADEKFEMFSSSKLSWNKNEATQFITKALDSSIKFAFLTVGYAATAAINAVKLSNTKIKQYSNKNNSNFKETHDKHVKANADEKAAVEQMLDSKTQQKDDLQAELNAIQNGKDYDTTRQNLEKEAAGYEKKFKETFEKITTYVEQLQMALEANHPDIQEPDVLADFLQRVKYALQQEPVEKMPNIPKNMLIVGSPLHDILNEIKKSWRTLRLRSNKKLGNKNDLETLINGTETVKQLETQIAAHQDEVAHWDERHIDKIEELTLYWNMLETGRNTKTGKMYNWFKNLYKTNAQNRFDGKKAGIIADYMSNHSIRD